MKILIIGGAGFIGSNVANSFMGNEVIIADNLSRDGVNKNLAWLQQQVKFEYLDVRDANNMNMVYAKYGVPDVVFHFAAQVGVQASIANPQYDLDVNAKGTLNLLEAVRLYQKKPLVVFASTNKVYGELEVDTPVSEAQPLSFCTPYGCSKGAAEQYMLDYYRVYAIPTVVLRMSCVYGQRQFGTEEQGWLCHFMRNKDNPITIYGDGSQIRDILHIDDYIRLCHMLVTNKEKVQGQVFNIGGGKDNTISVKEAIRKIGNKKITYAPWRASDQKYYVSNITKVKNTIGWEPQVGVASGLERLEKWVQSL